MTDKLTPVRCGCGGEAIANDYIDRYENKTEYFVHCVKCGICSADYDTETEAITAWNRAMSGSAEEKLKAFWDGMSAEMKEERKKGKWKPDESGNVYWICSVCGFASEAFGADILYHFCPNCGADMRGE